MANVLIIEPSREVHELLTRVVTRLGHAVVPAADAETADVDVVLLEPALRRAVETAGALRQRRPDTRVICVSIVTRGAEVDSLEPLTYVMKPFALGELEHALGAPRPDAADAAATVAAAA